MRHHPLLLCTILLLAPAVLLAQGRPSAPDDANESTGIAPAPPIYEPLGSVSTPETTPAGNTAAAAKSIRISGGVMNGMVLTRVDPVFPSEEVARNCGHPTVLSITVGADGRVKQAQFLYGPPQCSTPMLDAIRQWTYKPYLLNGKPVPVSTTVTRSVQYNAGVAVR